MYEKELLVRMTWDEKEIHAFCLKNPGVSDNRMLDEFAATWGVTPYYLNEIFGDGDLSTVKFIPGKPGMDLLTAKAVASDLGLNEPQERLSDRDGITYRFR